MRTIAVISQKGGAGKTTLAVHLAVSAAAQGCVSLIVDTDPQATASRWGEWRNGADPEVIDCGAPALLGGKLAKAADLGADLAVIDTPPHADAMARQAAKLADLILVPCRPKAFDLAAIETTADLIRAAGRPAAAIFVAGPPKAPLIYSEAAELIKALGLPVAPVSLAERGAFHHATAQGRTAGEYEPQGKAATEAEALWMWACEQLDLSTSESIDQTAR